MASEGLDRAPLARVPPLLSDLYQFTMAYAYWRAGRHAETASFELFFRDNPFGGGFCVFCGLNDCLMFINTFRLGERDVEYLRTVLPPDTHPAFFSFLQQLDCRAVTVRSLPEGTVAFARVPLMEVSGPLVVVQLLESSLLCLVNYASLVCSNAARFRVAAGSRRRLMELGLRRAQGPDGGLTASRYSYMGGFDVTSNVLAGFLFGIPVAGTMAHSYITSFTSLQEIQPCMLRAAVGDDEPVDVVSLSRVWLGRVCDLQKAKVEEANEGELAAFLSFAVAYPNNFLPVIDSYSVSSSGLLNFCAVALTLCDLHYKPCGVRLDSGDLCRQSVEVRRIFHACAQHFSEPAFLSLMIVGTNNISERGVVELSEKENEIDVVGVGTHLVTCTRQPSLGCVYKLVEVSGRPRMKLSEDPDKSTVPGRKDVYRLLDAQGQPFLDLLCLRCEPAPEGGVALQCHLLGPGDNVLKVTPCAVECLQQEVFSMGKVAHPVCSVPEIRGRVHSSLGALNPRHKRLRDPDPYPVALSGPLFSLLTEIKRGMNNRKCVAPS